MKIKRDYEKTKQRIAAFWEKELADRPLVSVLAPKTPGKNTSPFKNDRSDYTAEQLRRYWEDPETVLARNVGLLDNTYLGGDALPVIFLNFGPSGHAAYFGSKPLYQPDTVWYQPVMEEADANRLVYDEAELNRQLEIVRYMGERLGGRYFVSMPDNTGATDVLAALMGAENLLMAFLEDPDGVKQAIRAVNEGHRRSTLRYFETLRALADEGSMHGWMHLYAPGVLQHMQCDISVMLSPTIYEEFVIPELVEQMQWIEYSVYHFDGIEQTKHLDLLLSLKDLRAIQWTHVAGQAGPAHHMDTLKRIQAAGKGLVVMTPKEDVRILAETLDPRGLYIHTAADTPEEADALVDTVARGFRRTT